MLARVFVAAAVSIAGLGIQLVAETPALAHAAIGDISTVVGNGTAGYSGDGGSATSAQLASPAGVAIDSSSNLYVADTSNNRIRKVTPEGTITTIAGNGTSGYSGDGAAASDARALVVKHHIGLSHQLHSVVIISSHVIGLELRTSHHIVSKQTISQRECARTRDHQECVTVTIRVQRRVSERLGEEAPFDQHVTTPHDAHDFITRPRGRYVIDPNSTAVDKIQAIQSS